MIPTVPSINSENERPPADGEFANHDQILLGMLTVIDRDSQVSQRSISRELNVALGLANAYLKRCVRKGLIKVQQVPRRRYAYYLTPQGFAEKARLTGQYFSASFMFFRFAREQISALMEDCLQRGWKRVAFVGVSELAEVGTICAHRVPINVVGIIDAEFAGDRYCGLPVVASPADLGGIDAVIVTATASPEQVYRAMVEELGADRVLAPRILRISLPKTADRSLDLRGAG